VVLEDFANMFGWQRIFLDLKPGRIGGEALAVGIALGLEFGPSSRFFIEGWFGWDFGWV